MPAPRFADLMEILGRESDPETGVVSAEAEGRIETEVRKASVDFLERFFLWRAQFRPAAGSRGIRFETVLTLFGKVRVARRYVPGDGERPGFAGRAGRCTRACEGAVAEEGCERGSFRRAEAVARARGIDISASKIREVTLRCGREACGSPAPERIDLTPKLACGGERRRTAPTMVLSADGTCAPCAAADLDGVKGRDGGAAKGRNIDVGMVAVYSSVRRGDNRPVIPPSSRVYLVGADAGEIGTRLRETARAAGYGKTPRVQFIGDGAAWIWNIAEDGFRGAVFTLDCYHALGYASKVCDFLAGGGGEARKVFRKVRDRMLGHGFGKAEKYLRNKFRDRFTEEGMKLWSEEAAKAWRYLDARRAHMNYGWLRRHGYLIGSGHIESACKVIIGQRCKGPGMHWRYRNAIYVSALRARMRSAV